ncbi:hypothetical protein [Roseovarius sp.]|uniref:hypothetical protein n=1 Tax=Roseovarius sp. TaxID=1486281 RepID=UPI003B59873A
MPKNINITSIQASKADAQSEKYLFDGFCELLTRVLFALEEEEWAQEAGWDIAFRTSVADADAAWKLVALQADAVSDVAPLTSSDLLLRRMAGLIGRAVSAATVGAICDIHAKAMECRLQASQALPAAVHDLAFEAEACLEQMFEHAHACEARGIDDSILPLAA